MDQKSKHAKNGLNASAVDKAFVLKIISSLTLIAGMIGAYFVAPQTMRLWVAAVPPLAWGWTMEIPMFGPARWAAVGCVWLVWFFLRHRVESSRGTFGRQIVLWLAGSFLMLQICLWAILAFFPEVWAIPDEFSFYTSQIVADRNRTIAIPMNTLTSFTGWVFTVHQRGHISFDYALPAMTDPDAPSILWRVTMYMLTWLPAALILSRLTIWIGRKMRSGSLFEKPGDEKTARLIWCALLFLPYYIQSLSSLFASDHYDAYTELPHLGLLLATLVGVTLVLTPLVILLLRATSGGPGSKRRLGVLLLSSVLLVLALLGAAHLRGAGAGQELSASAIMPSGKLPHGAVANWSRWAAGFRSVPPSA